MSDPFGLPTKRPKQKTYGKSVKSHVAGWFGSKLWTEKDSEDARAAKVEDKKDVRKTTNGRSAIQVVQERKKTAIELSDDEDVGDITAALGKVKLEQKVVETEVVVVDTAPGIADLLSDSSDGKSVKSRKSRRSVRSRRGKEGQSAVDLTEPTEKLSADPEATEEKPKPKRTGRSKKTPVLEVPETPYPDRSASPSTATDAQELQSEPEKKPRASRSKKSRKSIKEDEKVVEETPPRKQVLAAVEIISARRVVPETVAPASPSPTKAAEKPKKRLATAMMTTTQTFVPATPQVEVKTPKRIAPIPVSPLVTSIDSRRGSIKKKPPSPLSTSTPFKRLFTPRELPLFKPSSEEYNEKITLQADEKLEDVIEVQVSQPEEPRKAKTRSRAKPKRVQPTLVAVEEAPAPAEDKLEVPKTRKAEKEVKEKKSRQTLFAVEIPSSPATFKTAEENLTPEPSEEVSEEVYEYTEEEQAAFDAKLETLLSYTAKKQIDDFTKYVKKLERESVVVKKLGEASFSEVFVKEAKGGKQTVIKIIPFGGEKQCQIDEILQEVKITSMMSAFEGFINFNGLVVTSGFYPESLINMWDDYADDKGTENDRPDFYEEDQLYAIILLEHGGRDLEHFELTSWAEALDVFFQTVSILAHGEEKAEFEHRDLHWGNIVIKRESGGAKKKGTKKPLHEMMAGVDLNSPYSDLKVSLIDYTLSRARLPTHTVPTFTPLSDPALFTGKGDYQYDIYRFMRRHLQSTIPPQTLDLDDPGSSWGEYRPKTNIFWCHYLLNILLNFKKLKKPGGGRRAGEMGEEEEGAYKVLEGVYRRIDPRKKRFGGEEVAIESAQDLWKWAKSEGMV